MKTLKGEMEASIKIVEQALKGYALISNDDETTMAWGKESKEKCDKIIMDQLNNAVYWVNELLKVTKAYQAIIDETIPQPTGYKKFKEKMEAIEREEATENGKQN